MYCKDCGNELIEIDNESCYCPFCEAIVNVKTLQVESREVDYTTNSFSIPVSGCLDAIKVS